MSYYVDDRRGKRIDPDFCAAHRRAHGVEASSRVQPIDVADQTLLAEDNTGASLKSM